MSGATLEHGEQSNVYEAVVDRASELSSVMLDVRCGEQRQAELCSEALAVVRAALERRAPMYEIVSALRSFAANERPLVIGAVVLRFSQPESRLEILNAGMPAVACVLPDGKLSMHAALSARIGERFGEVHPYELAPLAWGSSWIVSSDGFTGGKQEPEQVRALWKGMELPQHAHELAATSSEKLADVLVRLGAPQAPERDASMLVVNADPTRRFRSGIRP
ncbi:MAG: SpoIIE family protein phosphatase [Myxococcota bacterium]